jgi:hypothetical protein
LICLGAQPANKKSSVTRSTRSERAAQPVHISRHVCQTICHNASKTFASVPPPFWSRRPPAPAVRDTTCKTSEGCFFFVWGEHAWANIIGLLTVSKASSPPPARFRFSSSPLHTPLKVAWLESTPDQAADGQDKSVDELASNVRADPGGEVVVFMWLTLVLL